MKNHRESWNDFIYILKETPTSQEILSEIKSLLEKWKTDLGSSEFSKIEEELKKEFEEAKLYIKTNKLIINKNEESKAKISENSCIPIDKKEEIKADEKKRVEEIPTKKGFKKIQICEEEIPEETYSKKKNVNGSQKKEEKEVDKEDKIDADIDDNLSI